MFIQTSKEEHHYQTTWSNTLLSHLVRWWFKTAAVCNCPAKKTFEPRHDKTNKGSVRPAKTQISWASAQSDQSLRCPHEESLGP